MKQRLLMMVAEEEKYLNSATAGNTSIGQNIAEWIHTGFKEIVGYLDPVFTYGISSVIVILAVIWFCSKDRKAISKGLKWFFIYIFYSFLRGQLLC